MEFDEQAFHAFDLNALVTFLVVYRERGVSRAASKLNVTQPAVSNVLSKLRRHLGDPLFIPRGREVQPTDYATQIARSIEPALLTMQEVITSKDARSSRMNGGS
ncbi:LysR family transcriptional regulator [Pseudomonas resinovorans]|uniref:LysR family transcriptional regulator n=1 Tax=Metapseudomonas resinovorans TaxID=53412 RepID=A0ABT4Y345_METRE|nr:LysR family transcriptional regulator [Pseudomonas resinovorans]MDA8483270.1 LysR family transcriptional regulator [Pseudomonas resinovorans]